MYYNPYTKETLDVQSLRNRINVSFPDGIEKVQDWHHLDQKTMHPAFDKGQIAIKDKIIEKDGRYFQTYAVKDVPVGAAEDQDRIAILEKALMDLAQTVSSIESGKQS